MIQRFTFVKLRDAEVAARDALAERLRAALVAIGADAIVALPADASAARWDLSITITAVSLDAWRALEASPAIAAMLDELAARSEVVKAWTFEAVAAP